ncbi:MAG: metal-sensitive transcriptional regulator [Coriobacteriia bacterium]|nr:metal-sensitive transcriptional regulator [Coriobacteriia bacterium]MBN2847676.1 metal-sensitive transcriptional regulator [Coriobacteriia bacterium]
MDDATDAPLAATDEERRRIINRLKRLEGQIRGLQTMIESGKDCEAVLTQIMAAKSALNQVGLHIIGHSMKTCLVDDGVTDRDELIDEAIKVFLKYSSCVQ